MIPPHRRSTVVLFSLALLVAAPSLGRSSTLMFVNGGGNALFDLPGAFASFGMEGFRDDSPIESFAGLDFQTGPAARWEVGQPDEQSFYEFEPGVFRLNEFTILPLLSFNVEVAEPGPNLAGWDPVGWVRFVVGAGDIDVATRQAFGFGHRAKITGGTGFFSLRAFDEDATLQPRAAGEMTNQWIVFNVVPEPSVVTLLLVAAAGTIHRRTAAHKARGPNRFHC